MIKKISIVLILFCGIAISQSDEVILTSEYLRYRAKEDNITEWFVMCRAKLSDSFMAQYGHDLSAFYFEWWDNYENNGIFKLSNQQRGLPILDSYDGEIGDFFDIRVIVKESDVNGDELAESNPITIGMGEDHYAVKIFFDQRSHDSDTPLLNSNIYQWIWKNWKENNTEVDDGVYDTLLIEDQLSNKDIPVGNKKPTYFKAGEQFEDKQFNYWNKNDNSINHYDSFYFNENDWVISYMKQIINVNIYSNLNNSNSVKLKDPWLREPSDSKLGPINLGTNANWHPVNGQVEVFFKQNEFFDSNVPIYSLIAEDTPGGVFSHWEVTPTNGANFEDDNNYADKAKIVFKEPGTSVTAVYMPRVTGNIGNAYYPDGLVLYGNVNLSGNLIAGKQTGSWWNPIYEGKLVIEKGTHITVSENKMIRILGDVEVLGTSSEPVVINGNNYYGLNTFGKMDISHLHMSGSSYGLSSQGGSGTIKDSQFNNHSQGGNIYGAKGAITISNTSFSNNTTYGLYTSYSDEVNITGSTFANNDTGLLFNRSSGRLRDNDFTDNNTYGAWFYNRSSGDLAKQYINGNTKNNHFEGNGVSGSYINDYSYPLFGLFFYTYQSGYNTFAGISGKDIKAENTGWIWAQNNWWEGPPNVIGNVMVYPTADNGGVTMPSFKSKDGEVDSLTQVVFDADSLIADSLYDEGLALYKSVISTFPDDTASTMALSRLYTLIPQLSEESELYAYMDEVHTNHPGTLTGRTALFMDVALTSKVSGLEAAIDQSQLLIDINEQYGAGVEEKAAALLQHSDLLTQKEILQNAAAGKERAPEQQSEEVTEIYQTIADQYPTTGAAEIVSLLYGIEKPNTKDEIIIPDDFTLYPAYPNPFNPSTSIKYYIPETSKIKLTVYNLLGEEVKTLSHGHKATGFHQVQWNGKNQHKDQVPSGMYFYTLRINLEGNDKPIIKNGKMVLLK